MKNTMHLNSQRFMNSWSWAKTANPTFCSLRVGNWAIFRTLPDHTKVLGSWLSICGNAHWNNSTSRFRSSERVKKKRLPERSSNASKRTAAGSNHQPFARLRTETKEASTERWRKGLGKTEMAAGNHWKTSRHSFQDPTGKTDLRNVRATLVSHKSEMPYISLDRLKEDLVTLFWGLPKFRQTRFERALRFPTKTRGRFVTKRQRLVRKKK